MLALYGGEEDDCTVLLRLKPRILSFQAPLGGDVILQIEVHLKYCRRNRGDRGEFRRFVFSSIPLIICCTTFSSSLRFVNSMRGHIEGPLPPSPRYAVYLRCDCKKSSAFSSSVGSRRILALSASIVAQQGKSLGGDARARDLDLLVQTRASSQAVQIEMRPRILLSRQKKQVARVCIGKRRGRSYTRRGEDDGVTNINMV